MAFADRRVCGPYCVSGPTPPQLENRWAGPPQRTNVHVCGLLAFGGFEPRDRSLAQLSDSSWCQPKPNIDPSCSTSQKSLCYTSPAVGFINPVLYDPSITTAAVPSLINDSSPPLSSVKVTRTLMTLPSSDA